MAATPRTEENAMTQADPNAGPAATGLDYATSGVGAASKNLQALASEIAEASKESFDHATKTLEKLRGAHSVEEVVAIQTNFVKEAFDKAAQHTKRFGELMTAFPLEITKSYQDALTKCVSAAVQSTEAAGKAMATNVERFSDQAQRK
jgi:hypothetical protein